MLTVGSQFPKFEITACVSRNLKQPFRTLNECSFAGKWIIYFFWPNDFTPICATEFIAFTQMVDDFAERDAVIVGGSVDSEFVHLAWCRQFEHPLDQLPYPLLADTTRALTSALGVLDVATGTAERATFIVDPGRTIRHISINDFSVGRNPKELLRILDALQTDALCPSNWSPGEPTIDSAMNFIGSMPVPAEPVGRH